MAASRESLSARPHLRHRQLGGATITCRESHSVTNQPCFGKSSDWHTEQTSEKRVTRRFIPPSPHQNCRLSFSHEQGSARRTCRRRRIAVNGRRAWLLLKPEPRGKEISIRMYFRIISRVPVLTGLSGRRLGSQSHFASERRGRRGTVSSRNQVSRPERRKGKRWRMTC